MRYDVDNNVTRQKRARNVRSRLINIVARNEPEREGQHGLFFIESSGGGEGGRPLRSKLRAQERGNIIPNHILLKLIN